jgi:hypothetical protein
MKTSAGPEPDTVTEHAGDAGQRQARRIDKSTSRRRAGLVAAALLVALVSTERIAHSADDAPPVTPQDDQWRQQLLDERRQVEGHIRSLDRELAPYDRDRLRAAPLGQPTSRVRDGQHDPLAERRELERRNLQDRRRTLDFELRR